MENIHNRWIVHAWYAFMCIPSSLLSTTNIADQTITTTTTITMQQSAIHDEKKEKIEIECEREKKND